MPFPTKLLAPGEEVVQQTRPSWTVLVGPFFVLAVTLAACVAVVVAWGSAPIAVGYVLAAVALLALSWTGGQLLSWRSRLLVVTTRRVVYRWGVLRRTGREIPLERVQDVTYHQTLLERLTRSGSLLIESAGASGEEPFPDVRRPAELQSLINQLVSEARQGWSRPLRPVSPPRRAAAEETPASPPLARAEPPRWVPAPAEHTGELPAVPFGAGPLTGPGEGAAGRPPHAPSETSGPGGELHRQLVDLEELHEAGVLTDAEFDSKRRQLLGLE